MKLTDLLICCLVRSLAGCKMKIPSYKNILIPWQNIKTPSYILSLTDVLKRGEKKLSVWISALRNGICFKLLLVFII